MGQVSTKWVSYLCYPLLKPCCLSCNYSTLDITTYQPTTEFIRNCIYTPNLKVQFEGSFYFFYSNI